LDLIKRIGVESSPDAAAADCRRVNTSGREKKVRGRPEAPGCLQISDGRVCDWSDALICLFIEVCSTYFTPGGFGNMVYSTGSLSKYNNVPYCLPLSLSLLSDGVNNSYIFFKAELCSPPWRFLLRHLGYSVQACSICAAE